MASVRTHLLNRVLKTSVKKRLETADINARELARSRKRLHRLGQTAAKLRAARVNFTTDTLDGVGVIWCEPKSAPGRPRPTLLHFHGGDYLVGSAAAYRGLGANLALAADVKVALIDYRLAPEAPFLAAVEDALSAYKRLLELGHHPQEMAISGDSAGGNLALVTLLNIVANELPQVAGAILMSPWADLTGNSASIAENARAEAMLPSGRLAEAAAMYAGNQALEDWLVSPVFGDFRGLPPLLTHVGTTEILRDDARLVHAKARAATVPSELKEWPGVPHVFQAFADLIPEGAAALEEIATWLNKRWKNAQI